MQTPTAGGDRACTGLREEESDSGTKGDSRLCRDPERPLAGAPAGGTTAPPQPVTSGPLTPQSEAQRGMTLPPRVSSLLHLLPSGPQPPWKGGAPSTPCTARAPRLRDPRASPVPHSPGQGRLRGQSGGLGRRCPGGPQCAARARQYAGERPCFIGGRQTDPKRSHFPTVGARNGHNWH